MASMQQYQIHLTRHDAARNMQRYCQLSLDSTLFGGLVLTWRWGRIGCLGNFRQEEVETEIRGLEVMLKKLKAKRRRGYSANVTASPTSCKSVRLSASHSRGGCSNEGLPTSRADRVVAPGSPW